MTTDLTAVRIDYVDTHALRQVVSAVITHHGGTKHRAGHLPAEGWFCLCGRGKRCPHIQTLRDLIPGIAPPPVVNPASTPTAPPAPDGVPRE